MIKFSALHLLPLALFPSMEAFTPASNSRIKLASVSSSFLQQHSRHPSQQYQSTSLGVGAELDPEEFIPLGQECTITPEGFGFSSSVSRILASSGRAGGYYRAKSSDIVTDVMDGITGGTSDVALVFEDGTDNLLGIFTETDYIKVRLFFLRFALFLTSC